MTDLLDHDLDRLRAAHAKVPPPDPEAIAVARARVDAAIADQRTTRTPHRARLKAGARQSRSLRFAGIGAALAVAIAAGVAFLPSDASQQLGDGSLGVRLADAAQRKCATATPGRLQGDDCLRALAAVAGDWTPPGTGDVLYQRQRRAAGITYVTRSGATTASAQAPGVWGVSRSSDERSWIAPDGSGATSADRSGAPFLASPADRRGWEAAGRPNLARIAGTAPTGTTVVGGSNTGLRRFDAGSAPGTLLDIGEMTGLLPKGNPLRGLSTVPSTLRNQLTDLAWRQRIELAGEPRCAIDLSDCSTPTRRNIKSAFGTIATGLLAYPGTTRELREALLRVLADEPGYRTIGPATDPQGRLGVAVLLPRGSADGQDVLLIQTRTARPITQGMSTDRTLATTRWTTLYNLDVRRVRTVGDTD